MDEWGIRLRKMQGYGYKKLYRLLNPWSRKLTRLSNTWSKFNYQTEGRDDRKVTTTKQYVSMDERLKDCIKYSLNKRRVKGWPQRLSTIQTSWRDRRRRLKGGTFA